MTTFLTVCAWPFGIVAMTWTVFAALASSMTDHPETLRWLKESIASFVIAVLCIAYLVARYSGAL